MIHILLLSHLRPLPLSSLFFSAYFIFKAFLFRQVILTLLAEPIFIRDLLKTTTVGMTEVVITRIANKQMLFIVASLTNIAMICEFIDPIRMLCVRDRFFYLHLLGNLIILVKDLEALDFNLTQWTQIRESCPGNDTRLAKYVSAFLRLSLFPDLFKTYTTTVIERSFILSSSFIIIFFFHVLTFRVHIYKHLS